ncbi:hypothetical protein PRNP1_011298 [Phytophthora ramorum]
MWGRMRKLCMVPPLEVAVTWILLTVAALSICYDKNLCLADGMPVSAPSGTYRIDSKTKIKDIFKCSGIHFIGSFNEYYVACELTIPAQEKVTLLEIVDTTLEGSALSPLPGVHTELSFQLNTSIASVSVRNSQLQASAVEIRAANVSIDKHSAVNVTARGLKFGPGYNSWNYMGGSYGGIGGASLTGSRLKCDDIPPNDFFRAVGDVSGDMANFRGYGSGGGNDESRGGGRIRLVAEGNVEINGSLLANGGDACTGCFDSAGGAGGSILVVATERVHGNATVQANGGEPSVFIEELGPSRVGAYGGGFSSDKNAVIAWCQLGGDGTILKLQHSTKDDGGLDGSGDKNDDRKTLVGTLLVKGGRLAHTGPVKRIQIYGCTPVFEQTPRGASFLPESLAHIFISGGATMCTSMIQLKSSVGGVESSIVLDSGSELNVLDRGRLVQLSASQLTIQGYVGPSSLQEHDLFNLALTGADVSFSNALAMVHELDITASGALSIDKFSELRFRDRVKVQTDASAKIEGFLQPLGSGAASGDTPNKLSGGNGGGIIYVGSKNLNVTKTASISAQGGVGSMGGGGGSGGSLTLFITQIAGGGSIDLAGGAASASTLVSTSGKAANESSIWSLNLLPSEIDDGVGKIGGGGGGGIVRITYLDAADNTTAGDGEQFIKDGGFISVNGGESTGGENGGTGVMYKAQRLRDELSLETLTRTLTPRLTDQDLSAHVARLYLAGDNHLKSAWRLNPYFLPTSLRDIVEEGTYASFASSCNKLLEWDPTGWEAWLYRFLLVVMPPVGTLFIRRRQLHRVVKLSKYIVQYGGRFFRDMNFRVHGTQLKVGFSPDFSLGYFDVLISQSSSSSSSNLTAMQAVNHEDLVLVVGGSGSFFRPYHLDTNDIIIRAIPSRLELLEHNFWIDFVAEMNQKLRVLPQPSSAIRRVREAAEVASDIIAFVDMFNENHMSDGFTVAFGTFSVGGAIAADGNESCFESFTLDNVDTTFASYPLEAFKLAFRVSKLNSSEASPAAAMDGNRDSTPDYPELSSEENDRLKANTDPRSADFRYSHIRMEALFAVPERRSLGNFGDDSSDDSDSLTPLKKPLSGSRARALVEFLCTNDTVKRWLMALWQPVYPLFRLRNLPRPELSVQWPLSVIMVLLLIADMGVAFWILVEYYCVQIRDPTAQDAGCSRTALWSVLSILPAAIVGSPLLGLVFVTRKSIFCGKLFAVWNTSSIVNQVVAFVCGLAFLAYIHDEILLVAVGGVLIKYLEKEVTLRCIAQYASERRLGGWRGLHTTRDWYDAAYAPLVHYES